MISKIWQTIGRVAYWLTYPGIFIVLNGSSRVRVVIYADNHVLVVKDWLGSSKFSLPGGGVKKGEDPKQTARREVLEETGIELRDSDFRVVAENLYVKETGIGYMVNCYYVHLPKILSAKRHGEISQIKWLKLDKSENLKQLSKTTNLLLETWLDKRHLVD